MKGPNLLLLLGGVAALLFFVGKRRAPTSRRLMETETQRPKAPAAKKKKKKKPDLTPSPGFSFAGSVIGQCPYNGEAGLLIEYEDGTTECVPAVDL
jgi:hypothetical protein